MSVNRLLVAAARGARIRLKTAPDLVGWSTQYILQKPHRFEVHPDDAHLLYGPVSSKYLELAQHPSIDAPLVFPTEFVNIWSQTTDYLGFEKADELTRSLWALFMVEALLDEGM